MSPYFPLKVKPLNLTGKENSVSKSLSYHFSGTKGQIVHIIRNLPPTGSDLLADNWEDISDSRQAARGYHTYRDKKTGLRIRFDEPSPGSPGFRGKAHFHILNPNATSTRDMYLDVNGNPVAKNSKASHIFPKEDK